MPETVKTAKGKVELDDEVLGRAQQLVDTAFDVMRTNRGLPSDTLLALCHVATRRQTKITFGLYAHIKDTLIAYQDTNDQTRYTRPGAYQPFTEAYEETRHEVRESLLRGNSLAIPKTNTVRARVIYDMLAAGETHREYGDRVRGWVRTSE